MITKVGFSQVGTQNQNRKIKDTGFSRQNMKSEPSFGMVFTYGKLDFMHALETELSKVLSDTYKVRSRQAAFSYGRDADNVIDGIDYDGFAGKRSELQTQILLGDAYNKVTKGGTNFGDANILVINKKNFKKPAILVTDKETSEQLITRILKENSPMEGNPYEFITAKIKEMPDGEQILIIRLTAK